MKTLTKLAAAAGLLTMAACTTTPLTFEALDADGDGLTAISDVAASDKLVPARVLNAFDTDGDAQFSAAEFATYLNSAERATAIQVAEAERAERLAAQRAASSRNYGGSSGGGGGYGS